MVAMKRLRVLHVLNHSLPTHDGYVFRTLAILKGQRAAGFDTFHLTTPRHEGARYAEEEVEGWHFHRTLYQPDAAPRIGGLRELHEMAATARRLAQLAGDLRPDLLHVHSPVLNALPALWVGRRRHIPVVYEVRALWEDGAVDHGTSREQSVKYRLSRAAESFALRHADAVTTICQGLKGDIVSRGIAPDKVTVVANGVDVELFQSGGVADEALRERLGLGGCFVLGYVGSFYGYEGVDLIIDAVAALAPRMPRLRALLVGGGMQDEFLRARARQLGVADKVLFVGRVPNAEVNQYYNLIDFLVYPRKSMRLTELVTPLKPLEAMAQGRLVVASDVGGHRELIEDARTGLLFKADDVTALTALVEKYASRAEETAQIRAQARRYVVEERRWQDSVAAYGQLFARLCAASTPAR